ncbi:dienelactone hydrolase family protein [Sinorhizobium arboris]|uniref:dienelactone hydrolase family protein n=1 Tax=Sinorhizobium arboris TaxID=76745 RepID=UPI0004223274|nr:dienelactone hydrolase family protein [Sinorhizobium arboris]
MRKVFATMFALLFALFECAHATARQRIAIPASTGHILVERFASGRTGSRPAVLILSGSRGFGAASYDEIGQTFSTAGLDTYLVHVLSSADLESIESAGNASARVRYYAKRLPDWTSAVHDVISYLKAQPQYTGKVGVLGISLGAQIAAAASVETREIGALVLVDGAFPSGYPQPVRPLPPLLLIWGSADRTFPLSVGQELRRKAQALGGAASLDTYEGAAHDFFLKSGARQAQSAHRSAADFLTLQLR